MDQSSDQPLGPSPAELSPAGGSAATPTVATSGAAGPGPEPAAGPGPESAVEPRPRRRPRWLLPAVVVAVLALGAAGAAAYRLAQPPAPDAGGNQGVAVSVAAVARRDLVLTTAITGTLSPKVSLNLNAKVSGVVARVNVVMGQAVKAGQALLELSAADLQPQVKAAQAAVDMALSQLQRLERGASWQDLQLAASAVSQAQAGWDAAVAAYERLRTLYAQGAISKQQFETAETQVKLSTAQLSAAQMQYQKAELGADAETVAAARAQVRQAEASLDAARARVEDTVLRAPVAGLISYVQVSPGELIGPGVAQIGLVDVGSLFLEAALTENIVSHLTQGQKLPVQIPALGLTLDGTVAELAPAADPRTRVFAVRISVANNDAGQLRAGMSAATAVETARADGVLVVPREAVVAAAERSYVFVVADGVASRVEVALGLAGDADVQVTGLQEGQMVVTVGAGLLRDGARVNVIGGR